jgi:glucose-1-phosphate adenylyltransferase
VVQFVALFSDGGVKVHSGGAVDESIIFDNCTLGPNCRIRRAIIDENVEIPEGECVGYNVEHDRAHYDVTETGIVVVSGRSRGEHTLQS